MKKQHRNFLPERGAVYISRKIIQLQSYWCRQMERLTSDFSEKAWKKWLLVFTILGTACSSLVLLGDTGEKMHKVPVKAVMHVPVLQPSTPHVWMPDSSLLRQMKEYEKMGDSLGLGVPAGLADSMRQFKNQFYHGTKK